MNDIQKLIDCGGYATVRSFTRLIGGMVSDAPGVLSNLENEKLIEQITSLSEPGVKGIIHVTKKACAVCGRSESRAWRAHSSSYISRSLILSDFLFPTAVTGCRIISFMPDKFSFLMGKGFEGNHIPFRRLRKKRILRIDEHLICGEPFSPPDGFCIVYPDKCNVTASTQLNTLIRRYGRMLLSKRCAVRFLVICRDALRADEYNMVGLKLTGNGRGSVGGLGGTPLLLPVSVS